MVSVDHDNKSCPNLLFLGSRKGGVRPDVIPTLCEVESLLPIDPQLKENVIKNNGRVNALPYKREPLLDYLLSLFLIVDIHAFSM